MPVCKKKKKKKKDDVIQITCDQGFRPSTNRDIRCTKDGWIPTPSCDEITCSAYSPVENGKLLPKKSVYKYGDTIEVECEDGYVLQTDPDKPRTCTSNGWYPPARCVRKRCDRPDIQHGSLIYFRYFPKEQGETIDYRCDINYVSHERTFWGRSKCTKLGWNPEPKCSRQCSNRKAYVENSDLINLQREYLEGEKVRFQCKNDYQTQDGRDDGERTCLPDGEFTPAKCSRICKAPKLPDGKIDPTKDRFEIGEILQYECNKGFMTESRNLIRTAQCLSKGWSEEPSCIPITCKYNRVSYKDGDVIQYTCAHGHKPESKFGQCYYYGWGPPPNCQAFFLEAKPVQTEVIGNEKQEKQKKCPLPYHPIHAEIEDPKEAYYSNDGVTMTCVRGYKIHGPPVVRCIEGKWEQPPECIELTPCKNPPRIENGDITESSKKDTYVANDTVTFGCTPGYHLSGPNQSTCLNGQWTALPTCTENSCDKPPEVTHSTVVEEKKTFNHGEKATYKCENGFRFSGTDSASCVKGSWINTPACVATSCTALPRIPNSRMNGQAKATYASGEKVTYVCDAGYSLESSMTGEAQCENTNWINLPVCRRIGTPCGPPPVVQFGDTISFNKPSYQSGESVLYKCAGYYALNGSSAVRCQNGVWDEAPICLEPCTSNEKMMEENNIQLKWLSSRRLYSLHGDIVEFTCKPGYEAPPQTQMRTACEGGKLNYPKCFRAGFCVLDQSAMLINNIQYNVSSIVDNGQTITFFCGEGTIRENNMEAKCHLGKINYPKCVSLRNSPQCGPPPFVHYGDTISFSKPNYYSGDSVEYKCPEYYTLKGNRVVKCMNGVWGETPVCLEPCTTREKDMEENNIQLKGLTTKKVYSPHGEVIEFECKFGYEAPSVIEMNITCVQGKLNYPKCFNRGYCVLDKSAMITNNVFYNANAVLENGERFRFQCNSGMIPENNLEAKCEWRKIKYPKCVTAK
ncbi:coagulation factor XIII B chain-like [Dendropsophus ebraccatus]|uniref:coagulation factor XIII B chain-like n=1 Tax=Dendropsophus ebraccatus TaxID=150705 RepID=UPI0038318F6B